MKPVFEILALGTTTYFQPQDAGQDCTEARIQKRLAVLVGTVAFGLPIILALGAWIGGSCFRDSISHFYYAQFLGAIMVGMLIFIGGFLIAYTGEHWLEDIGSVIAGVGACFVALFPASGNGCEYQTTFLSRVFVEYQHGLVPPVGAVGGRDYFQLFAGAEDLHAYAAAALFIYLALYCLVVLKRIIPVRHMRDGALIPTKKRRNVLYSICGAVILICIVILGFVGFVASDEFVSGWNAANLTFFAETVVLWAFGTAWFAKGRVFKALNDPE